MSKFKVVPTPDHGTRLVPANPTPKTEEEWLAAACEHDITYGQDSTPPGSHTPGPWSIDAGDIRAPYPNHPPGISVARMTCFGAHDVHMAKDANARLIAAAPELLEALYGITTFLEADMKGFCAKELRATSTDRLLETARAAIAKATGGAL